MPQQGPSDQTLKLSIVLATGVLALTGFFLEVGPVGGAFQLALLGFQIELPALGFLAYLALAASAVVGLHISEKEPVAKEEEAEAPTAKPGQGEAARERVRVRPELHQLRMFITALGGFVLLKSLSIALMWQTSLARSPVTLSQLIQAFQFGFFFTALGWFVLWQFLRWYAERRRWERLQRELVGANVTRIIAVVVLIKPLVYFISFALNSLPPASMEQRSLALLLHLAVVFGAVVLWAARPRRLRQAVIGLFITEAIIIALTVYLAVAELRIVG